MTSGLLDQIVTPAAGNAVQPKVTWCADNAVFADKYPGDVRYVRWLLRRRWAFDRCTFAVAPDVVGDARATLRRSASMLPVIRSLGIPVALAGQDGIETMPREIPWPHFDVAFLGGTDAWKLGPGAAWFAAQAKARGLWVHMGRVNSRKRMIYAHSISCDSVDGTFLAHGPDRRLPEVLSWLAEINGTT